MLSDQATILSWMAEHPKLTGDRTTLAVMLALADAGNDVAVPFGESCRYDLVVAYQDRLLRVQCKSGRLRKGVVEFATASTYGHHKSSTTTRRSYHGQIDAFAVYCRENGEVYLAPIADVDARKLAHLRLQPTLNGQARGVRFAAGYTIAQVSVVSDAAGPSCRLL